MEGHLGVDPFQFWDFVQILSIVMASLFVKCQLIIVTVTGQSGQVSVDSTGWEREEGGVGEHRRGRRGFPTRPARNCCRPLFRNHKWLHSCPQYPQGAGFLTEIHGCSSPFYKMM
jgi:hypothetical protein